MTKKQSDKIEMLLTTLPECQRDIYQKVSEYAVELGYSPSIVKNAHGRFISLAFSKKGKRLIKINPPGIYSDEMEFLMQFYAAAEYSDFFHEKVRQNYERTGASCKCNCEKCVGKYTYIYPDGREAIRCAIHSLIELSPIETAQVNEVKTLMKLQDDFWMERTMP